MPTKALRITLFGQFRIERDGETVRLPTRKAALLLAYLALHPGPHGREKLAARFWPEVPDGSARASLRNALSTLRRKLGRSLLVADRQTAQLNPAFPLWVDAVAFRAEATRFLEAPRPDPEAVDVALYGGELLVDFYDEWVRAERKALRRLYHKTLLALTRQLRAQSEYEGAREFAQRLLADDRANERAHQHLIFCHAALADRGAALRQYEACRTALREELAVEPSPATKKLYEWVRPAPGERRPGAASLTNLPIPLTRFVGRRRALAAIGALLDSARLVTLTGAGGSGKTRLALQVGTDLLDAYADGVWWVELAALADPERLPRTVAKALGVPEAPQRPAGEVLAGFLRPRELLLVLDNCEHLLAGCARLVEQLLRQCPGLTVLATSREKLGIGGEHVWPVPPLSVPAPDEAVPAARLQAYEAVDLFVGRAQAAIPDFELRERNAAAVAAVCRRLDGLPLAIELAAARVKVLPVAAIAARLDDAFQLLTGGSRATLPRHRTLRAAMAWSFELLAAAEQMLFRRLSVFAGGWTLAAAEAVCAGDGLAQRDILDLLSRLVDKSLVEVQARDGEKRFRMLETVRQYARERLTESGEAGALRSRHLAYFRRLVEAANPLLGYFLPEREGALWLGRLEPEVDNVRAALDWSLAQAEEPESGNQARVEAGLRLAGALHWFWYARGQFAEGRAWLTGLLARPARVAVDTRAQALLTAGYMACWQGDFAAGRAPLREALDLYRRLENGAGVACARHGLGFVAMGRGNLALAGARFADALQEAKEAEAKWVASFAFHFLAIVHTYQGEYAQAVSFFEEGDALLREMGGYKQGLAFSQFHLGRIARLRGKHEAARAHHAEGMRLFAAAGDRRGIGYSLAGLAALAAAEGRLARAARLAGAVAAVEAVLGSFLEAPLAVEYEQSLATVRAALDEEAFAATAAEGRAMSPDEAMAYALAADAGGAGRRPGAA